MILCPTARASEIRFAAEIPAADAARWESRAREDWASWERQFGTAERAELASLPPLVVSLSDPEGLSTDAGRTRGGRITLNRLLTRDAAEAVFLHELAHVFFENRCASMARSAPLLSEAFALFASGDAARRSFEGTRFLFASSARDWLLAHAGDAHADSAVAQQALARVLAQPESAARWEGTFSRLLASCGSAASSPSGAMSAFLDEVRGVPTSAPAAAANAPEVTPSVLDFLLVDGLAGEMLAEEGRPRARFPPGSILKPSLVAAVPSLMEPRVARAAAEWHCPTAPKAGEFFTWERALAASCNGFFLDFPGAPEAFGSWTDEMAVLGVHLPDRALTMAERIGLRDGITLSPVEAVRLFAWLDRKAPFVVDALRRTPASGTLAGAPEAAWFLERGIALKTGTVRDAGSAPLHAWIVAVGPRGDSGAPAFVAALHATSRATAALLPELKRRLTAALTGLETPVDVQILGLVPGAGVGLACDGGAPLLERSQAGNWKFAAPRHAIPEGSLVPGTTYACTAAPVVLTFADGHGTTIRRRYFGSLRVEFTPALDVASSVPLRERSARARRGSRFVLATSERAYVTSAILSELPAGHSQLLAALALVVRNNRLTHRHGDRPPCDTTHCNLFGQDGQVPAAARRRAQAAVASLAAFEIAAPRGGREWLPFSLGGSEAWTSVRTAEAVARALGLDAPATRVTPAGKGEIDVSTPNGTRRFACEVVRNQLRLPSCPESAALVEGAPADRAFHFRGAGEGHGAGLDLTSAAAAAAEGADARTLLVRAWPELRVVPVARVALSSPD